NYHMSASATAIDDLHGGIYHEAGTVQLPRQYLGVIQPPVQVVHLISERLSPHGHHLEIGLSELEPLRLVDVGGLQLLELAEDHALFSRTQDRKSTRLNSSHVSISYA